MYTVYLLISQKDNKTYVGMTTKGANERLTEHNLGSNDWTSKHKPFTLIYYETYYCKQDALLRESFLKSGIGNRVVKALKNEFFTNGT